MTKSQEIIDDIDLLIENSKIQKGSFIVFDDGLEANPQDVITEIYDTPDDVHIAHSQAIAISKIFFQQSKPVQADVKKYILGELGVDRDVNHAIVTVFFLIGSMDEFIEYISTHYTELESWDLVFILERLNHLLFYFWSSFSKTQIKTFRAWVKDVISYKNPLGKDMSMHGGYPIHSQVRTQLGIISDQTNIILTKDVEKRIELGFNPEINEDELKIKEEFSKYGFPPDLSEALDKVDQMLNASRDAFDFKGTMDLLRSFTERFYRTILDQYGAEGKKIHDQDSEEVSKFFVEEGLVNEDFGKMIASQRHFISNTASHRLKSREEDARLSRNMVIEMSLYIIRRFQNH